MNRILFIEIWKIEHLEKIFQLYKYLYLLLVIYHTLFYFIILLFTQCRIIRKNLPFAYQVYIVKQKHQL
jgi:hypothetical protein